MKSFFWAALACLALLTSQNELQAQISWSESVPLFAGGDNTDFISQNGTFVLGVAPGGVSELGDGVVATVGTAQFLQADQDSGMPDGTITSVTTTQNGVTFEGLFSRVQAPTFGAGEFTDPAAVSLMVVACWNNTYDPDNDVVTFSGLTAGDTYEIQVLVNDARGRNLNNQVAFTNGSDQLVAAVAKLSNRENTDEGTLNQNGDFVVGTFVADTSGIQTFNMSATRGGGVTNGSNLNDQFIVGESIDLTTFDPPGSPRGGTTQINAMQLRNISDVDPGGILGDADQNGVVNFADIGAFITILAEGGFLFQADIDGNLMVEFDDIGPFITILAQLVNEIYNWIVQFQLTRKTFIAADLAWSAAFLLQHLSVH